MWKIEPHLGAKTRAQAIKRMRKIVAHSDRVIKTVSAKKITTGFYTGKAGSYYYVKAYTTKRKRKG